MTMELDYAGVRAQLSNDAFALNLVEFWEQRMEIEIEEPRRTAVPHHWNWSDISPRLAVASRTVPIEECERRALVFANPGLSGKPYITQTLFAAYSLYNPGERGAGPSPYAECEPLRAGGQRRVHHCEWREDSNVARRSRADA
jgi:gentisate 1,2-dioxygenase